MKISQKNCNEESDEGYFLEVDAQYLEKLQKLQNDLPLLHERMKIEKVKKPVANLLDKTEYVTHIKLTLNHGLVLKKLHRIIKSNQIVWLKPYIDINTDLRKKAKNYFNNFFLS